MKSRLNTMLAGLALTVPFLVPAIGTAEEVEPTLYVSSTSGGKVGGVYFADEDILAHGLESGGWERYFDGSDVGLRGNDVNAFHIEDDGTILMALKKPQRVGGFWADDSDVIAFHPTSLGKHTAGTFEKVFDGSDVGLRTSAEEIDALAMTPDGRLLLSTSGSLKVPRTGGGTLWGADEDLIVFNAESLGTSTAGSFERYFDGSDVGLRNSSEDVWGAWVDPFSGDIAMTTKSYYKVPGLRGDKEDVIAFTPDSLGYQTTGTFFPGWDGDDHGLSGEYLDGLFVDPGQPPEQDEWFQASLTNDWVQGWGYEPGTFVSVRIFDHSGFQQEEQFSGDAPVDGDGYFYLDREEHGVDLTPGMYIEVDARSLELAELSFDVFDSNADVLRGKAPIGAIVEVGGGNETEGFGGTTVTDVDGNWFVDLMTEEFGFFNLADEMGGQAWINDADGDQTVAEPPPLPQFQASLTNDWVQGWNFTPNDAVTVTIFDFMGTGNAVLFSGSPGTDGQGNFNLNDLSGLDLMPGLYITVEDSVLPPRALVLEPLTFSVFETLNDTIGGTAAADATVEFNVGNEGSGVGGQVTADGSGWSSDLNTEEFGFFDLTGAMGGQAWISDDDGDQTVAEPRFAQFQASLTNDWVQGWNFTYSDNFVLVEIFDVDSNLVFSGFTPADSDGNFNLDREVHGQDLIAGMYITVDDPVLPPRALVLEPLTFEVFDIDTETIGGTATAGATVQFGVGNEGDGRGGEIVAAGGNWSVDLSADPYNFDLTGAMGGQAWISDADGDQTVAEPPPFPQFQASLTSNWVQGWNFTPGMAVLVQIFDSAGAGNAELYRDAVPTDGQGNFNDDDLLGLDLMPGMYVTVAEEAVVIKSLVLEALTFDTFDFDTETIGGTATAGATVQFGVGNEGDGRGGEIVAAGGNWSVDLSADPYNFDLTGAMGGQAWISDADGDQTVAEPPPFPQFQASLTSNWVQGWNFTPGMAVLVQIFDSAGAGNAELYRDAVPTDGQGNFNDDDLLGLDLMPGMYVTVAEEAVVIKSLVLEALTFDMFDFDTETIGGTATAGATVQFGVGNEGDGRGGEIVAAGGNWSVDLNTSEYGFFDITDDMGGQAWVSDGDGDQTVAEPPPPPGEPVNVTVSDQAGSPVPGAIVDVLQAAVLVASDSTDSAGTVQFSLDTGVYDLTVTPQAGSGLASVDVDDVVVSGPEHIDIVLLAEMPSLSGRLLDPVGDPVAGGYVDFEPGGVRLVSDADGGFVFEAEAGVYSFEINTVYATRNGRPLPSGWMGSSVDLTSGDVTADLTLPFFEFDVRVVNADGTPAGTDYGARVVGSSEFDAGSGYTLMGTWESGTFAGTGNLDENGELQLHGYGTVSGDVTVWVFPPGAPIIETTATLTPDTTIVVELAEMPSLSGRLLDPVGDPVAGGYVDFEPGGVRLVSDADGGFVFEAEAGVYSFEINTVYATRNGRPLPSGWMGSSVDLTSGDVTADLTLPFFEFDVRVVNADGTPAGTDYGARVVGSSEFDAGSGYTLMGTWESGTFAGTGNLDENGELQLHGYGTVSGDVTVWVFPPGAPIIETTATLTPDTTIVVELAEMPSLSGRLLDPVGDPVAGGYVDFEPGGVRLVSDADGGFVFEAEAGVYSFEINTVYATRNGRPLPSGWMGSSVDLTSGDVTADLTLPFFEFDVRVVNADGTPAGTDYGARVVGSSEFDAGSGYTLMGTWESGTFAGTGNLDENGELQLHGYGTVSGDVTVWVFPPGAPIIETTATLTPDTTIVVVLAA